MKTSEQSDPDEGGTTASATAILDLLRHVQVLAREAGMVDMAVIVETAFRRCVDIHVAKMRRSIDDSTVRGPMQ